MNNIPQIFNCQEKQVRTVYKIRKVETRRYSNYKSFGIKALGRINIFGKWMTSLQKLL